MFKKGARVQMNAYGRETFPTSRRRKGTTVSVVKGEMVTVKFDDLFTSVRLHLIFLEPLPTPEASDGG